MDLYKIYYEGRWLRLQDIPFLDIEAHRRPFEQQ